MRYLFLCLFTLAACSKAPNNVEMPKAPNIDPSSPEFTKEVAKKLEESGTLSLPQEDLGILNQMVIKEIAFSNKQLDVADKLEPKKYIVGQAISAEKCLALEQSVSKNYQLHSYEARSKEGTYYQEKGVDICPKMGIRDSSYIDLKSVKVSIHSGPVVNSAGVKATKVVSVSYNPLFGRSHFPMLEQYLLDDQNKIVEYVENRILNNEASESWSLVSTLTKEGHIVARVSKTLKSKYAAHAWKAASTFVAGDGTFSAMRVFQNDGNGVEAVRLTIDVADKTSWTKFEISPLTRIHALYEVNGEVTDWLKSKMIFHWSTRGKDSCGSGHIGYTSTGGAIREFGDKKCEENLDINKTIH